MSKKIVIDTETTGFNAKTDELLQVSIIDTDGNVLFDSFLNRQGTANGKKRRMSTAYLLKWSQIHRLLMKR